MISSMKDIKRIRKAKLEDAWLRSREIQLAIGIIAVILGLIWFIQSMTETGLNIILVGQFIRHFHLMFKVPIAACKFFGGIIIIVFGCFNFDWISNLSNMKDPKTKKLRKYYPRWYNYI